MIVYLLKKQWRKLIEPIKQGRNQVLPNNFTLFLILFKKVKGGHQRQKNKRHLSGNMQNPYRRIHN